MIRCTIGVFAHNEAHNVRPALQAILAQELRTVSIVEIIVVASGCTDNTVELAQEIASLNPLVTVDVERHRRGKASAIRRLIARARGDVIVFVGADTLPAPTAIEHLLAPFADPRVGMTGARVVPLNSPATFMGFAVQMLWWVHHQLALRKPKLGELVACRNVIHDFPTDTATDDLALEALVTRLGYRLAYAPAAVVYNKGPEHFRDFALQRRRIFAGEVRVALRYGYLSSSLRLRHVLPLAFAAVATYPRHVLWTCGVMAIELWARLLGTIDAVLGREAVVWRHAASTKNVTPAAPLTLISVQWSPDQVDGLAVLRELQRLPPSVGSVFWWDCDRGEVLVRVEGAFDGSEWLPAHLQPMTREVGCGVSIVPDTAALSCKVVQFAPSLPHSVT